MENLYRPKSNRIIKENARNTIHGMLWKFWSLNLIIFGITYLLSLIPELFFDTSEFTDLMYGTATTIPREVDWTPLIWSEVVGLIFEIVTIPLYFGYYRNVNNWSRGCFEPRFKVLFSNYKSISRFFKSIAVSILSIIICVLGLCLLIVPGIMLALSYTLVPYLFYDEPDLSVIKLLKKSREMMKGYKGQLFTLYLSFLGWMIVGACTFGILYIWVYPYFSTSIALFYDEIRRTFYNGNDPARPQEEPTILGSIFGNMDK